jgi:predicted RND superfamily exporter protein
VGPPAFFTAAILSAGFAVFMLSRFPDLRVFGLLSMTILLVGLVSDMVLTAVLLRLFFAWKKPRGAASAAPILSGVTQ